MILWNAVSNLWCTTTFDPTRCLVEYNLKLILFHASSFFAVFVKPKKEIHIFHLVAMGFFFFYEYFTKTG